jgi:hypothetical protein
MKISRKKLNRKWFVYQANIEFEVRPFPFSLFDSTVNVETRRMESTSLKDQFLHCLTNWKGLIDEDTGEEFKYNEENKLFLYDYYKDIRDFVFEKANLIAQNEDKEIKNS